MTNTEKIAQLRFETQRVISPLITGNCHLTNIGFHTNLGDTLIWVGSKTFIESTGRKVLTETSMRTWRDSAVSPGDVIVFNGGGNIGDIWRNAMEFMLGIIDCFPDNRIILLPHSAWYADSSLIASDAARMGRHKDLHLIARDNYSYTLMLKYFGDRNNVYLAPDMAFCIPDSKLAKARAIVPKPGSLLYLRRTDKEFVEKTAVTIPGATVSDWPTMSSPNRIDAKLERIIYHLLKRGLTGVADRFAALWIRNRYVGVGSRFIGEYERVVTTRLHTLILSVLVGRPVEYIDNISGKISAYASTWLSDLSSVAPYSPDKL